MAPITFKETAFLGVYVVYLYIYVYVYVLGVELPASVYEHEEARGKCQLSSLIALLLRGAYSLAGPRYQPFI